MHWLDAQVHVRGLLDREPRAQIRRQPIEFRLRLLKRDARLELSDDTQRDVIARSGFEIHAVGDENVRARIDVGAGREQDLEVRRQHADELSAAVAEFDRLADDRLAAAITALPELITDDGDVRQRRGWLGAGSRERLTNRRRRLRRAVFFDEVAAGVDAMAEQRKKIRRHSAARYLFGVALTVAADGRAE